MNFISADLSRLARLQGLSIKTRMAFVVAALVLVATIAVSLVSLVLVKQGMREVIREQQSNLLSRTSDEVDQNLYARRSNLESFANGMSKLSVDDAAALQSYLDENMSIKPMFAALLVVNERGMVLAKSGQAPVLDRYYRGMRQSIAAAFSARHATFSSPRGDEPEQLPMVVMTNPVVDNQGVPKLIVVGLIDLRNDRFFTQLAHVKIGKSGYFYMVTGDGLILLHPDKERILQKAVDGKLPGFAPVPVSAGIAQADEAESLLLSKRLESADWTLWEMSAQDEMFAPIAVVGGRAAFAAAFLAFSMGGLAWLITRRQIVPLQRLRERIRRVQDNPTQLEAPASYRGDEIGILEASFDRLVRERLHAEAQFREMETELHAAVDCSLDAFFIFKPDRDASGKIVDFCFSYLNATGASLFGKTPDELAKSRLGEILPAIRTNGWFEQLVSVISGQRSLQGEYEADSPAIFAQWLHYQIVPLADGLAVTMRDISAGKRDEVEVRENRVFLQSLIEYLPVLIFAKSFTGDTADTLIVWNKTAEHVMGYSAEQVIGKKNSEIFPPKVADTLNALDRQMHADPKVVVIPEFPYRRPDGALRYLHSISVPLFGEEGKVDYILGIVEDVTVRRAQEWALRNQQAEMEAVNDALPLGLFRTDSDGNVIYVNSAFEQLTGIDLEELKQHGWLQAVHPDDRRMVQDEWEAAIRSDLPYQSSYRFRHRDGRTLWTSVKAAQIRLDGKVRGYVGSVDDITARRQAEQAVRKGERWLRTITDNVPALIAYIDLDERYRFCNVHYERAFNNRDMSLLGRRVAEVIGSDDYALVSARIAAALRGEKVRFERESVDHDGVTRYWRVEYLPDVQDAKVAGFYSMLTDITELKHVENRLRTLARIDSLTGLANRAYFNEKLADAIAACERDQLALAVMFLDIDHFKAFNDSFGHHGGDLVLREFSRRLSACIRHTDTVARLAGDEFVILIQSASMHDETEVVAKKIMAEMERDFEISGNLCRVTTSIGITIRRNGENDIETLLRRADDALYSAKSAGRNAFKIIS